MFSVGGGGDTRLVTGPALTVRGVAEIVVPKFADWRVVDVIDENGALIFDPFFIDVRPATAAGSLTADGDTWEPSD